MKQFSTKTILLLIISLILNISGLLSSDKKPFTTDDAMKFKWIQNSIVSDNGHWIANTIIQDRGDGELVVFYTERDTNITIPRGIAPVFTKNSEWLASFVKPKAIEMENADKDKPKNGMAILNLKNYTVTNFENIKEFKLSNDSKWIAYKCFEDDRAKPKDKKDFKRMRALGTDVILRHLETGSEIKFDDITEFSFDSSATYFSYVVSEESNKKNAIYLMDLKGQFNFPIKITDNDNYCYSELTWNNKTPIIAFVSAKENKDGKMDSTVLNSYNCTEKKLSTLISTENIPAGWYIPFNNSLLWTKDGQRLFFGFKPAKDSINQDKKIVYNDSNYFSTDAILKKVEGDVWHWNDPRIKTHQKIWWQNNKDSVYRAVYWLETKRFVQLADTNMPTAIVVENPDYSMGVSPLPYLKERTWDDDYNDIYSINLKTGARKLIVNKISNDVEISPWGKYILYFNKKHWFVYSNQADTTVNLTEDIVYPFYDVDDDHPMEPPSYGCAGWMENDESVFLNDKFDVWRVQLSLGYGNVSQTAAEGRFQNTTFRLVNLDREKTYWKKRDTVMYSSYSHKLHNYGIYRGNLDILGVERIFLDSNKRIRPIAKAKNVDRIIYSRESYNEYPDVWITLPFYTFPKKITKYGEQLNKFNWGSSQLIDWVGLDKDTLQGYILKPANYNPEKKYPVVVYFYEKMTQRLCFFERPWIGHRPCFQVYNSNDYVIFFPDVVYKTGKPGMSAYNCILPGINKLLDMGIADPNAIGIWGHSWSGYQTAYLISKTNIFKAAVAGATVGNMTSAYSGIRLESGLARQFQYEKGQSRLGGNLWDSLNAYIDNSPIFQAKTVQTPLLIMAGDIDNMVPWEQSIEIYMAWRRLNKNCIFLQYHNEKHWPDKYANRMDYAIKMMEFYDHYLKNKPAPEWITKGVEYNGK